GGNRRHFDPHMPRVLQCQMTKAADTKHSDKVTRLRWCVSQGVERRESRAKQRRGICRRQIVRDTHEPGGLRDHHLGISTIRMNPRVFLVATVHEIAISTEFAITARASQEADTNALTKRPALDARAKGIDPPDHFVPRDARPADWKGGFHRAGIRVADTARLDANAHLTGARIDQRFHYGFEFSRFRYLDCSIHCTRIPSFIKPGCHGQKFQMFVADAGQDVRVVNLVAVAMILMFPCWSMTCNAALGMNLSTRISSLHEPDLDERAQGTSVEGATDSGYDIAPFCWRACFTPWLVGSSHANPFLKRANSSPQFHLLSQFTSH